MTKIWMALATGALLAACDGGGAAEPPPAPRHVTMANPFHDSLTKLTELGRRAALRRAIRTAKESCDRVDAATFQQDHGNLKMWTARCRSNDYAVFIAPNGDVQVRNCKDAATLKLPMCRPIAESRST